MSASQSRPLIITVSDFPSSGSRLTTSEIVGLCRAAEIGGLDRFTISDFPFHRDLIPLMTACLTQTRAIVLESCVTSPHYRLPETTACTFATMAELSDYRVILGIGRGGVPLNIPPWGRERPNAIRAMEEMLALCRMVWRGERAPATEFIPSSEMSLNFAVEKPIPILVAAGGRQMLALAARLADIVHVASPFLGRAYLGEVVEHIHTAGELAGRAREEYEVDITVPVSILPDGEQARRLAKVSAAMGISWMAERRKASPGGNELPEEFGPAANLIEPITSGWRALGDEPFPDHLAELIDEDVLSRFSIAGTKDECKNGLMQLVEALPGVTGLRVKLPSLTGVDAAELYAVMIAELASITPDLRAPRVPAPAI
jgi:alkanesulfonate monooxygenase SsuD/methylene tetrahydromethanopterin reductase-like flavin-dependent oxidoreductase (luciferase family)